MSAESTTLHVICKTVESCAQADDKQQSNSLNQASKQSRIAFWRPVITLQEDNDIEDSANEAQTLLTQSDCTNHLPEDLKCEDVGVSEKGLLITDDLKETPKIIEPPCSYQRPTTLNVPKSCSAKKMKLLVYV